MSVDEDAGLGTEIALPPPIAAPSVGGGDALKAGGRGSSIDTDLLEIPVEEFGDKTKEAAAWVDGYLAFFGRIMAQNGPLSAVRIRPATEWAMADRSSRPERRLVQVCRRPRAQF